MSVVATAMPSGIADRVIRASVGFGRFVRNVVRVSSAETTLFDQFFLSR
jgi:hypothetical protein